MRMTVLLLLGVAAMVAPLAAAGPKILLIARDRENHALPGLRFTSEGIESSPTNHAGATELQISPRLQPGDKVYILLISSAKKSDDWFLIGSEVVIPKPSLSAVLVLMHRSEFRQISAEARDLSRSTSLLGEAVGPGQALIEVAARYGLKEDQLEKAIRSFSETQDLHDRGVIAYVEGQFSEADALFTQAKEAKEKDLVETLRYRGATRAQMGDYRTAVPDLRKALLLQDADTATMTWLGITLLELAEWSEAEVLLRRALTIDQDRGSEPNRVAQDENNLGQLLRRTGRFEEAEPLLRQAVERASKTMGPEHLDLAQDLTGLALLLLDTGRLEEAELLARRAVKIDEKHFRSSRLLDAASLPASLDGLALVLEHRGRLEEAYLLLKRALELEEANTGLEHPCRASLLNNMAVLLYSADCFSPKAAPVAMDRAPWDAYSAEELERISESMLRPNPECTTEVETILRQALGLAEQRLGPQHPTVASILANLGDVVPHLCPDRLQEAETLYRRALEIVEKSFGPDSPKIVVPLLNSAITLKKLDRLEEAEVLFRRGLTIQTRVFRQTGRVISDREGTLALYTQVLESLDRAQVEIEVAIKDFKD